MKILELRVTDGPNYWSIRRHQLVVMTLDLEELEDCPTHKIPGFYERIVKLIPTMYSHRCSEEVEGGFFHRVETGTWMGHVIEHIALEIQTLAGMSTGFGRTREAGRAGHYHVVFSYLDAEAGKYAAQAAVRIAEALVNEMPYRLGEDISNLRSIYAKNKTGPSTLAIIEEAARRNIPVLRLNEGSLYQLGYGAAQRKIEAAVASTTSNIGVEIASDKAATKRVLTDNCIPVADGVTLSTEQELAGAIEYIGYPIVIKPLNGNHGNGATTSIMDAHSALKAYRLAKTYSDVVICEKFVSGFDFRILVVNYRLVAAALRTPAAVIGNGMDTIRDQIHNVNQDPQRGDGHENILTRITLDDITLSLLEQQGYTPDSVLPNGKQLLLKPTANLSTGGTATDVTDLVHPENAVLFGRIARVMGLDICGIDVIAPGLDAPLKDSGGVVLEVNAGPGLRMHLHPTNGKPRNVAKPIIDMLFPGTQDGRIPIIAVTGTNGKTTTTRLIAHIGRHAGYKVGNTTTDGVYIHNELILKGDCTGPVSARLVLKDPGVNLAVLECARGGMLRGGLGFDQCDIAVITNIAEDHLGMNGIDTLEKLARLKGVLAETVTAGGYAVLNADDDQVYDLSKKLACHIAFFSMSADNLRVRQHVRDGGIGAIYENGFLTVIRDGVMARIGAATEIPITFSGHAEFNIYNALAASLAAFIQGIEPGQIFQALRSFTPSAETLPGRLNLFDFGGGFRFIVDYAHNTHGLQSIGGFLKSLPATKRIGVIAGVGDRRDQDIISLGAEAANIFDEIIIRQDADLRGREAHVLNELVCRGIRQIDPFKKITIIPDERKAIEAVFQQAENGMVAAVFADDIQAVLTQIQEAQAYAENIFRENIVA